MGMRQYRIGDLTTGTGYTVHASSRMVALHYVFRSHIDEFLHAADYDNERVLNLIVTDLGASMWIQRVVREPDRWRFDGVEWYGDPRTEVQRVLVADGIPDGWKRVSSTKTATRIYRDTCGICGAKSPQEATHKAHN